MRDGVRLRVMKEEDIAAADQLRRSAGWNQRLSDWRRTLRYQPDGCFVAECESELIGTVTTTTYGSTLGWIGMMLVSPAYRRQGVGTALMKQALQYLQDSGVDCIKLDATPAGQPVYENLGFQTEWMFHRWARAGIESGPTFAPASGSTFEYVSFDVQSFGADRYRWLAEVANDSCVIATADGFGMIRNGDIADYLGPVSTTSEAVATKIIGKLLARTQRTTFWDIPSPNENAVLLATALGFQPVRDLTRMWLGSAPVEANLQMQYALCDPGMG